MSKLLTALQKLDAQSASKSAGPPSPDGKSRKIQPPAAPSEPVDPLARITELNELLEVALSSQRTWLANELAVRKGFEKSLHPVAAPTPPTVEPTAPAPDTTPPPSAAIDASLLPIAREFSELAAKLIAEIQIPAAVAFTTTDTVNSSCFWLLPLATALLQTVTVRVLILEATAGEPGWARQLGIEPACQLVEVLAAPSAWRKSVLPTAVPGIELLPGGIGSLPASVDVRQSFRKLLANLKAEYGVILVATGPAESPITKILASECGHAVLSVGLKKSSRVAAARAQRSLESADTRLIGSVVCG